MKKSSHLSILQNQREISTDCFKLSKYSEDFFEIRNSFRINEERRSFEWKNDAFSSINLELVRNFDWLLPSSIYVSKLSNTRNNPCQLIEDSFEIRNSFRINEDRRSFEWKNDAFLSVNSRNTPRELIKHSFEIRNSFRIDEKRRSFAQKIDE